MKESTEVNLADCEFLIRGDVTWRIQLKVYSMNLCDHVHVHKG